MTVTGVTKVFIIIQSDNSDPGNLESHSYFPIPIPTIGHISLKAPIPHNSKRGSSVGGELTC